MKIKKIVRDIPMINGWSALKAIQLNKEKGERKKNRFKRIKKIFDLIMNGKAIKVAKKSRKPFKSGEKINTVKGEVINEKDPKKRMAYTFYEDDSIVNKDRCKII